MADGNLIQLMELRSEDFPDLKRWWGDHNYLSHEIMNKMIKIMGNTLIHKLLVNIREACWFSISNHEQLTIRIDASIT